MEFLGYVISDWGNPMLLTKVESILSWQEPQGVKDVQVFLGFANFYTHYIHNLSAVAAFLTELTKGNQKQLVWGSQE